MFGRSAARHAARSPRFDEGRVDAEAPQRVVQQIVRAAVQRAGGDDMRAGAHQRGDGQMQRGLAAGRADRARAVFQRGDTFFEHGHGRIGDPRIDVTGAFHIEERRGVVRIAEGKRGGLVDRRGARAGGGVGGCAGVQRKRVETVGGHPGRRGHERLRER